MLGLERTVTGTCTDEKRLLLLGPALSYGSAINISHIYISVNNHHPPTVTIRSTGNRNGSVPPNSTVNVEVEVVRVRNKKPVSFKFSQYFNPFSFLFFLIG